MNTITIKPTPEARTQDAVMFRLPDNEHVAHGIFLFLAENLQPGFVVELAADGRSITQPSGLKGQGQR
jgi:hypothetical protein